MSASFTVDIWFHSLACLSRTGHFLERKFHYDGCPFWLILSSSICSASPLLFGVMVPICLCLCDYSMSTRKGSHYNQDMWFFFHLETILILANCKMRTLFALVCCLGDDGMLTTDSCYVNSMPYMQVYRYFVYFIIWSHWTEAILVHSLLSRFLSMHLSTSPSFSFCLSL